MKPYLVSKNFDLERLKDKDGKYLFSSDHLALYALNANPSVPTNNGIGVLGSALSCEVTQELNGQYELEMRYPIDGDLFNDIQLRCLIVAQTDRTSGNQPFRIYEITKPLNGIVTIRARHLAYDLSGVVVKPFVASNIQEALNGLKSNAMTNCPFTFVSSRSTTAMFAPNVPTPIWSLMGGMRGSLLDVYGGEYTFDNYTIHLENRRGADNGASVRYGVNMTDLEQDENCENCYTGVVAYWQTENDVVYSPVVYAIGHYGYVRIKTLDLSGRWDEKPTALQLKNEAEKYIVDNQIGVPRVSWKVNFVPLDTTEEYKDIAALEAVSLGDTVKVKFDRLGVDASARVNAIVWDVLLDRYVSVQLGNVKSNIADIIAVQGQDISAAATKEDVRKIAYIIAENIVADFIKAGKISADRIEGGTLALGRELNEAGFISIYDEQNRFIGAMYNKGVWFGLNGFSSSQNTDGFTIRKSVDGVPHYLVYIGRNPSDGTGVDTGFINMYSVDDDGNSTITAFINGKGEISCKRLVVNGHEIT